MWFTRNFQDEFEQWRHEHIGFCSMFRFQAPLLLVFEYLYVAVESFYSTLFSLITNHSIDFRFIFFLFRNSFIVKEWKLDYIYLCVY